MESQHGNVMVFQLSRFSVKASCYSSKVKVKVNLDICKAPLNTIAFSKALRYDKHTALPAATSHTCLYSLAAKYHRPLAGTHFTVPRKVEG